MNDLALDDRTPPSTRLLTPRVVAVLLAIGTVSFAAMLVLGAYAPDLGDRSGTGGHALSRSVNGYAGLVRLAAATDRDPTIVRNVHQLDTEDLLVATPESGAVPIDPMTAAREGKPTLIVLPKWLAAPDQAHRGWVNVFALQPSVQPQGVLAPATELKIVRHASGGRPLRTVEPLMTGIRFAAPRPLQAIRPPASGAKSAFGRLRPLVVDELGNIVVGRFSDRPLFVLADPDLLNNRGVRDAGTAAAALAMLDWMNANQAEGIAFDVTLNGLGRSGNPLKLLFQPPFVAVTAALAVAALLAALGTVARFGSPRPRERAIAFGKRALVDNTAALVRKAGREARLGPRYAEVIREVAVRAFGVPARLRGDALDAYLDRLGRGERFTTLAAAVAGAERTAELTRAAGALHLWMEGPKQ